VHKERRNMGMTYVYILENIKMETVEDIKLEPIEEVREKIL
jgi:hypothetical protein